MRQAAPSRVQIGQYLLLVFALSSVFWFLMLRAGGIAYGRGLYVIGLMWCPAIAALLTLQLNGRRIAEVGWGWGETKWQLRSWFIPLLYASISYAIVWISGLGGLGNPETAKAFVDRMHLGVAPWISVTVGVVLVGVFGLVTSVASGLGEEIGWRGFLVPELSRTRSFTATSVISGVVWSIWHYPLLIFGDYNAGTPTWYGLTCFTALVVAISFVFAWMRLRSGSVWTAAILHGSHNLYIQGLFTPFTRDTGRTKWFIDEFGAVLPVVAIAFALYFWSRRRELPGAAGNRASADRVMALESLSE